MQGVVVVAQVDRSAEAGQRLHIGGLEAKVRRCKEDGPAGPQGSKCVRQERTGSAVCARTHQSVTTSKVPASEVGTSASEGSAPTWLTASATATSETSEEYASQPAWRAHAVKWPTPPTMSRRRRPPVSAASRSRAPWKRPARAPLQKLVRPFASAPWRSPVVAGLDLGFDRSGAATDTDSERCGA